LNSIQRSAAFVGLVLASTSASASGLGFELNGARSERVWGGELGAGYRMTLGILDVTPSAGAFIYKGDTDYFETQDSAGKHCRAPDGRFAPKEKCDNTAVKGYARLEAGVTIPAFARIAVGGRYMGGNVRPYGAVSVSLAPMLGLKLNGGKRYLAAGLTFGY
jgi:hypothetical protein